MQMAALENLEASLMPPMAANCDPALGMPPLGCSPYGQMQMAFVLQGQLIQMIAAWLLIEQLTSGGGCGCQHRGRLPRNEWGRWRSLPEGSWQNHAPSNPSSQRSTPDHGPSAPRSEPGGSIPCPPLSSGPYDGRTPARECTSTRASACVDPPLTNSAGAGRDPNTYAQVINQFGVGDNPRYARRNGNTYCNIFAWDVTRAMGAELPHWRRHDGTPAQPFERGAYEMNANGTAQWLNQHGERYGWRRVSAAEAQAHANSGAPCVAIKENPGAIGHVAVVRPGEMTDRGPCIAQAGGRNFNEGHVRDVWRGGEPQYWVHA
jgi:hypothetical protein